MVTINVEHELDERCLHSRSTSDDTIYSKSVTNISMEKGELVQVFILLFIVSKDEKREIALINVIIIVCFYYFHN